MNPLDGPNGVRALGPNKRMGPGPWAHRARVLTKVWYRLVTGYGMIGMIGILHNSPLKGIGVRDIIIFLGDFSFFLLFSIGCESKFREILAYLEVGSSDLEPIHEKNNFHQISDIFMGNLGYIHG